jgi:hypothetical protein
MRDRLGHGIIRGVTAPGPIDSGLEDLTPEQRAWAINDRRRWMRAHELAVAHPGMDIGDLYQALISLEKTPSERLEESLRRANLSAYARRTTPAQGAD